MADWDFMCGVGVKGHVSSPFEIAVVRHLGLDRDSPCNNLAYRHI